MLLCKHWGRQSNPTETMTFFHSLRQITYKKKASKLYFKFQDTLIYPQTLPSMFWSGPERETRHRHLLSSNTYCCGEYKRVYKCLLYKAADLGEATTPQWLITHIEEWFFAICQFAKYLSLPQTSSSWRTRLYFIFIFCYPSLWQ